MSKGTSTTLYRAVRAISIGDRRVSAGIVLPASELGEHLDALLAAGHIAEYSVDAAPTDNLTVEQVQQREINRLVAEVDSLKAQLEVAGKPIGAVSAEDHEKLNTHCQELEAKVSELGAEVLRLTDERDSHKEALDKIEAASKGPGDPPKSKPTKPSKPTSETRP